MYIFELFLVGVITYGAFIVYMMSVPRMLHFAQLEGYKEADFFRWVCKNPKMAFLKEVPQAIGTAIVYGLCILINAKLLVHLPETSARFLFEVECIVLAFVYMIPNIVKAMKSKKERKQAKKPLVYTARAKRLMFWNAITVILLSVMFLYPYQGTPMFYLLKPMIYSLFTLQLPVGMVIALFLASPTETIIKDSYIRKAKWKLRKKAYRHLIKIGITGSYGKTSTKFILDTILSQKYHVLSTPESYNTTFGNIKVIREQLKPEHQVFIAEMGARYRFEIQEICDFVKPKIGIITSIGPQHLESFKKMENIVKAKKELIKALPHDGVVVLPNDHSYCSEIFKEEKRKKYSYALDDKKSDVYAKNIKLTSEGCSFVAVTPIGEIKCVSKLLGEHSVKNILGCIAIAIELGLTKEEIARGVAQIMPVKHRLQIVNRSNQITVIDDAFNSNPEGSKEALNVLKRFEGRKIIITPGMVELGSSEYQYNYEFGKQMADTVDIAILVGKKRSEPIAKGLRENEFDEMNLYVVDSLKSATKKLEEISQKGDVVLFENDLPDNYNE